MTMAAQEQLYFDWGQNCAGTEPPATPLQSVSATGDCLSPLAMPVNWDFHTTFPSPRPEALHEVLSSEDEIDIETLRALHGEHGRHCSALLSNLATLQAAAARGVDPRTGKAPSSLQQPAMTEKFLREEPARLKQALDEAMDAYAHAFGDEAASAFLAHLARQLSPEESCIAPPIKPLSRDELVSSSSQFDPGHPWHYLPEGDGATHLLPEQIESVPCTSDNFGIKLPKDSAKRLSKLRALKSEQEKQLASDIERYRDLLARGVNALSRYDRTIAYGGNDAMALAAAIALTHNHIAWSKGRVVWLSKVIGG